VGDGIHITQRGEGGQLEVVLDDLAAHVGIKGFPYLLVAVYLGIDVALQLLRGALQGRKGLYILAGAMEVDEVWTEVDESF
jgi:hypothetical protein